MPHPLRFRGPVEPTALAKAYLTVKGKCLDKQHGGLACTKAHAHEREIVSNYNEPQKPVLRLCARALRLAKKLSGEPSWTLWSQSDITHEFFVRYNKLVRLEALKEMCFSCREKKPETVMCKFDATQFFKNASVERGIRRIQ